MIDADWLHGPNSNAASTHRTRAFEAPADLVVASCEAQKATLTWTDNAEGETGYRLQYSTDGGQTWRLTTNLDADSTSTVTYKLQPETTYLFRLCAVDGTETTEWTTVEYTTPERLKAPTGLYVSAYDATQQKVSIAWKDNATDETGYRLQYSTDGGQTWRLTTNFDADATSCVTYALSADTAYSFRICAVRGSETSEWKTIDFTTS